MQLVDLLTNMTDKERRALAQRRLGVDIGNADVRTLAAALSEPLVVTAALVQLNAAQLRIVQWLAMQPDLKASWNDFEAALGDRLPPSLQDDYLLELQALALVDTNRTRDGKYLATYPAVRAALPTSRGADIRAYLNALRAETLGLVVSVQDLAERPTRKEQRIDLLLRTLTTPESCQALLARQSEAARDLFQWIIERGGSVDATTLLAHVSRTEMPRRTYYGPDAWWAPKPSAKELSHPLTELVRSCLVMPVSNYGAGWYGTSAYAIPEEVELASRGSDWFDGVAMQPPPLLPADQGSGGAPDPTALLRDVSHLLGFVASGRCEFKQDGEPYKRSLTALGKLLGRTDAGYTDLLWQLALNADLLRPSRSEDQPYVPVSLKKVSPHALLVRVFQGWVAAPPASVEAFLPQLSLAARVHQLSLLRTVPADTWLQRPSLDAWLHFRWPLVFPAPQAGGTAAPNDSSWAALGALLVARGTDANGGATIMMPAEHQLLLSSLTQPETKVTKKGAKKDADDASAALPPWDDSWTVQADRLIVAPPNAPPDAVIALWQVAKLESNQGASLFRISAESVAGALNLGLTPDAVRDALESRSRVPLPPTVLRLIEDQGQRYGRIKVGTTTTYITTDEPALLEELQRDKRLKKLGLRSIAPGVAVVDEQYQDAVMSALRTVGHLPVPDPPAAPVVLDAFAAGSSAAVGSSNLPVSMVESRKPLAPSVVRRMVRDAVQAQRSMTATWLDGPERLTAEIVPIDFHGHTLHAYDIDADEDVDLPSDAIVALALGPDASDLYEDIDEGM